jgi:ADP-ribose pyrophosphatase YjhB (NUDIX family)
MRVDHSCYCRRCGGRLEPNTGGPHRRCLACREVNYRNPAVGVAVIVVEADSILLGRRGRGAHSGRWCIPCGYVEWGEDIRAAARREMEEETGLAVDIGEVYAVHSNFHDPASLTVGVWFVGRIVGGALAAGDDIDEVGYFPLRSPPELAFPTDAEVIATLASREPAGSSR